MSLSPNATLWPFDSLEEAAQTGAIARFADEHRWLSNFVGAVDMYRTRFPAVENTFVAAKMVVPEPGSAGREGWQERLVQIAAMGPGAAKKYGRTLDLRPDWETQRADGLLVKEWVLLTLVRRKYADAGLARKLLATGNRLILEGNTWGDRTWGVIDSPHGVVIGANRMGAIAMAVREELGGAGVPEDAPASMPRYTGKGL